MGWLVPAAILATVVLGSVYLLATGRSRARVGHYVVSCVILFGGVRVIFASPWPAVTAGAVVAAYIGWTVFGFRARRPSS